MKRMDLNEGLIRDKEGIYSGLLHSLSAHQQLAICYNDDGRLIVKIAVVKQIRPADDGTRITLTSPDEPRAETLIHLDRILSIYPIRYFIH